MRAGRGDRQDPGGLPARSCSRAPCARLQRMGVDVRLNTAVETVNGREVTFKGGACLDTDTVVWTAGIRGAKLGDTLGVTLGRGSRVPVDAGPPSGRSPRSLCDRRHGLRWKATRTASPIPRWPRSPCSRAHQAAHNILAAIADEPPQPFHYLDKGNMATIGRRSAILDAYGLQLSGPGLAGLAGRPHLLPDRLPQPPDRPGELGLQLFHLRPGSAGDYGVAVKRAACCVLK